jgi:hypothetical protein
MKIYIMEPIGDIYQYITQHDSYRISHNEFYDRVGSHVNLGDWKPLKMQIHRNKRRKICDNPNFVSGFPVLSEKAVDVVRDFLADKADILPLDCGDEKYFLINIYNKIDCIDYDKTQYTEFESGRVREFQKFAFIHDKLTNESIFKIPEIIGKSMVFVSDEFRERIIGNGLVGFNFIEVWDSEK